MYERAADPPRSAPILRHLASDMGAQLHTQIYRTDVRAPINCTNCTSWENNRDGRRAPQPQGDHKDPDLAMQYRI